MCFQPVVALAQEAPAVPSSATEPHGLIPEPELLVRAVLFTDRQLSKRDLTNGIYLDYGNMVPGAGWGAIGSGYSHWYRNDSLVIDASASISTTGYKFAQARVAAPKFLKSRLALTGQARWQNFGRVDYFKVGSDTTLDERSVYAIRSTQLAGYATLRPVRWMDIDASIGWLQPKSNYVDGPFLTWLDSSTTFVPVEVSATIDTRDFPGHPTSGVVLRGLGAHYDDRTTGAQTFDRVEGEAAGFLPIGGGRVVLAVHGWYVGTEPRNLNGVPFYMQPTLGGVSTLRSFSDYRFHDDHMLLTTAELRLALMTHVDLAMFADAGNVAARRSDLDLDKRSYGGGVRFHTRRETFAMIDAARGDEGWRVVFRLKDPLGLAHLNKQTTRVPFVP